MRALTAVTVTIAGLLAVGLALAVGYWCGRGDAEGTAAAEAMNDRGA